MVRAIGSFSDESDSLTYALLAVGRAETSVALTNTYGDIDLTLNPNLPSRTDSCIEVHAGPDGYDRLLRGG